MLLKSSLLILSNDALEVIVDENPLASCWQWWNAILENAIGADGVRALSCALKHVPNLGSLVLSCFLISMFSCMLDMEYRRHWLLPYIIIVRDGWMDCFKSVMRCVRWYVLICWSRCVRIVVLNEYFALQLMTLVAVVYMRYQLHWRVFQAWHHWICLVCQYLGEEICLISVVWLAICLWVLLFLE